MTAAVKFSQFPNRFNLYTESPIGQSTIVAVSSEPKKEAAWKINSVNINLNSLVTQRLARLLLGVAGPKIAKLHPTRAFKADFTLIRRVVQDPVFAKDLQGRKTVSTSFRSKMFPRIKVTGKVVDLDGDEMTRIIWQMIKEKVCQLFESNLIGYLILS